MIRYRHISIPFSAVGSSRQPKDLPKAYLAGNPKEKVSSLQVKTYKGYEFDCNLSIGTTKNGTDILDNAVLADDYDNTINLNTPLRVTDLYFTLTSDDVPTYGSAEVIF